MNSNGSLGILLGAYKSLLVLIGFHASLRILMGPHGPYWSLHVLIKSNGSLWFGSLWNSYGIFVGPYGI